MLTIIGLIAIVLVFVPVVILQFGWVVFLAKFIFDIAKDGVPFWDAFCWNGSLFVLTYAISLVVLGIGLLTANWLQDKQVSSRVKSFKKSNRWY